jgi:putative membrane protein
MYCFGIFAIFTLASVYEIIERRYAAAAWGEQWIAFLGSQGDVRDAQKDMLADGLGALTSTALYWLQKKI